MTYGVREGHPFHLAAQCLQQSDSHFSSFSFGSSREVCWCCCLGRCSDVWSWSWMFAVLKVWAEICWAKQIKLWARVNFAEGLIVLMAGTEVITNSKETNENTLSGFVQSSSFLLFPGFLLSGYWIMLKVREGGPRASRTPQILAGKMSIRNKCCEYKLQADLWPRPKRAVERCHEVQLALWCFILPM